MHNECYVFHVHIQASVKQNSNQDLEYGVIIKESYYVRFVSNLSLWVNNFKDDVY